jgi:outer membrane immunogenic protein
MKKFVFASALLFAAVGGAQAADVVVQEAAPAYNWSGVYVGAQAGYAWGKSTYSEPDYDGYFMHYDPKGGFGGLYAGYNWQLSNNVVLGGEVDVYGGSIKGDSLYFYNGSADDDIFGAAKLRWAGSVRARAGYAVDRFLPYLAGGVAFGQYRYGALDTGGDGFSASKTFTGWTAGAGLEYAFTDNLIGRIEYRYTDFGKKTVQEDDTNDWYTNKVNLKTNDVRIGLSYKF